MITEYHSPEIAEYASALRCRPRMCCLPFTQQRQLQVERGLRVLKVQKRSSLKQEHSFVSFHNLKKL